jgi:predicted Ser/Thr protein kinase
MTGQEPAPDRLGNYRVLRRLGEGGMGVVYLAVDPQQRMVAVKALRQGGSFDPNARHRLAREVETMRRVHSPFVAEVLDADVSSEPPYIVTRYVAGRTLEDLVAESGPLSGPALARLAYGLASALTAVHAAGVVHRDLKPGNVMLTEGRPVVIDFGIAQAPDLTRLTMTGMFMGTPGYLAPEVIEGKQSGPAADVHSWGATVAFAATGRPPFGIGTFETIFYRIVHGQPDLDRFPPVLAPLVVHALARDPSRRPSAAELGARLAALDPASMVPNAAPAAPAALSAPPGAAPPWAPGTIMDSAPAPNGGPGLNGAPGPNGGPAPNGWPAPNGRPAPNGMAAPSPVGQAPPGAVSRNSLGQPGAGRNGLAQPGAATVSPAAWPQVTRPLGAASAGPAAPADYRDVLPPVQYGSAGSVARGRAAPSGAAWPAGGPAPPAEAIQAGEKPAERSGRIGRLLAVAVVVVAVSASVLLPIAGTAAALAALLALRAASRTGGSLARRRSARGSRATDPVIAAVVFPAAVLRSALRMVLLAPLAVLVGGIVAAITIVAVRTDPLPQACAYAAGAIVAYYGLGPGSSSCRKPLVRFFNGLGRTPLSAVIATAGMTAVAIGAIAAAATHPPFYWPFGNLSGQLRQLPTMHNLVHDARVVILRVVGR